MTPVYARLDGEGLKALLNGKAVELEGRAAGEAVTVQLILADIGWSAMLDVIADVVRQQADQRAAIRPVTSR